MIAAIETWYAGTRYRSRLEARWAVFFDRIGLKVRYEHEGYVINGRPYLPDFYVPSSRTWIEVKGAESELDHRLMESAAAELPGSGTPNLLILGPIPEPPESGNWAWIGLEAGDGGDGDPYAMDGWWQFGTSGIELATETSCGTPIFCGQGEWLTPVTNMVDEVPWRIVTAYLAARSARFEHGETPR